ncbi:hypothetical protein VMCG_02064 [Cytospora schulzeri]|uniref:Rhodopsin domain-containing protein n=1 Tax=Cytospora schulzeri TaxID=448051 RepID=A0A423X3F4_9PEZI|nr:hypothetical protein VMCG_02064 [Valsa malicola]
MATTVPEDARSVALVGLPLAIVVTTGIFLSLAILGVGTRIYVGFQRKILGLDDGMMVFSLMAYIAVFGLTIHGTTVGVGTKNNGLNAWMNVQTEKWYTVWILVYLTGMVVIKSSICVTLSRILPPTHGKMRTSVWCLMSLSWASWCVSFFGVLLLCRPIEATWDKTIIAAGKGECGSTSNLVGISQTVTVASVVTDIGCTVLPGILMFKSNMLKSSKLEAFSLLSIASIASIATLARAPYLSHYADPTNDLMYYCGYMVIFSNIETGIGLFASSLPAIRRLYMLINQAEPTHEATPPHMNLNKGIVTIGGTGGSKDAKLKARTAVLGVFSNPTDRGHSEAHVDRGSGSWERLTDGGSDNGSKVIRADYSYTVEMHPVKPPAP